MTARRFARVAPNAKRWRLATAPTKETEYALDT